MASHAAATRILERSDGSPTLVRRRCTLEVTEGPDRGRSFEIEGTSVRVGTSEEVDLVLHDDAVSSVHFELMVAENGWRLVDRWSTNGTRVRGLLARDVEVADEVEIEVGRSRIRFAVATDEVEVPLSRRTNFGQLLGHGPAMRAAFAILERAAKSDVTVLLTGETGTGKDLAARALHERSARRAEPFVVVDCGAVAEGLFEAQLFGHAAGAFTGAGDARAGLFESAHGGTLLLDEIGELPLALQPKLLRALEERTVQRLGEAEPRPVDVRFVASTQRNLSEAVARGAFREDLFYRLSVVHVRMPPLRERPDEIPRLVASFLAAMGAELTLTTSVLAALSSHRWPGNVRELRNAVERMVAMPDLSPDAWLPGADPESRAAHDDAFELAFHESKARWNDLFEREYLARLLRTHGDNVSEAARAAGLSRQTCYRLMKKHRLS